MFELVNDENKVIGRQTVRLTPSYSFVQRNNEIVSNYDENNFNTVTFNNVKADDISDMITIRIASVNGAAPENARVRIAALPDAKWKEYRDGYSYLRVEDRVVLGFSRNYSGSQQGENHNLVLPADLWGAPFITSIGQEAFSDTSLTNVTIPDGVTSIKRGAFRKNSLTNITIPNSVTFIGHMAFELNQISRITIGADVKLEEYAIGWQSVGILSKQSGFEKFYESNGRQAGTYAYNGLRWNYSP
ncbi:leucine-rich repeat domain-containing protein [Brucepastera parasyntrophica]|uniref:leucine-rich repeat domain-containing protein n=1 Tax=Brucepastera parasyntrophica TaxID=2880008 RepID=UPI0021091852|nr:leucine-rich repeat domain-containing protein [Brucepastera parasyntrophica]ULQ58655.1 leucine-rich repeat domain-containing protein [Brucepastera parasyntrophica]